MYADFGDMDELLSLHASHGGPEEESSLPFVDEDTLSSVLMEDFGDLETVLTSSSVHERQGGNDLDDSLLAEAMRGVDLREEHLVVTGRSGDVVSGNGCDSSLTPVAIRDLDVGAADLLEERQRHVDAGKEAPEGASGSRAPAVDQREVVDPQVARDLGGEALAHVLDVSALGWVRQQMSSVHRRAGHAQCVCARRQVCS